MMFVVTVVLIYTLLFKPELIISIKHDAIAALFYVSNWWYIIQDVDYFNQFAVAPLKHLWSLAIEEQFYLFFPFILLGLLKFSKANYNDYSINHLFIIINCNDNDTYVYR